ncbi:hypothetical protein NC653_021526 [Populus alba x Populus x berolinensis]|uniref:Uncharacterized protein n=1 Tax=Populus alba x Populus x berolinensis TaxID=444605 RepID=A0AAD6MN53_9ROSI|nr:hypothetical protein NC653_021526 [Populus alba x Populus x berolinensis]
MGSCELRQDVSRNPIPGFLESSHAHFIARPLALEDSNGRLQHLIAKRPIPGEERKYIEWSNSLHGIRGYGRQTLVIFYVGYRSPAPSAFTPTKHARRRRSGKPKLQASLGLIFDRGPRSVIFQTKKNGVHQASTERNFNGVEERARHVNIHF